MKTSEKKMLIGAIVSVALVATSQAMIASIYHGLYSRYDATVGGIGFLLFIGCLAIVLGVCDFWKHLLLKIFLSAFFFSNVYSIGKGHTGGVPMPFWAIVVIGSAFLGVFFLLFFSLGETGWKNISKFIIGSTVVFAISPLLISAVTRPGTLPRVEREGMPFANADNLLVIILDETSPEYAGGLIKDLENAHLFVKSTEVAAAGKSTINSLPSMFSKSRHDDVAPCNSTALCGAENFDFASLKSIGAPTDIVGFWHPYCAIQGLRSCTREESVFAESSSVNFGLYGLWCSQFNRKGLFAFCNNGIPRATVVERARKVMARKINQVPFWNEGGILLVHFPLPHPSMTYDFGSLKVEYEHNVGQAQQLVSQLTEKMMSKFGRDFAMVITSDHALRTTMWCASPEYNKPGCAEGLPPDRGVVPYIIASPEPINVAISGSNVGLLSSAFVR